MKSYKFRKPGLDRIEKTLDVIERSADVLMPYLLIAFIIIMLAGIVRS